ncbi:MAG: putative hydrolase [Dactylosporangium sp.]|nr:putative hydrolase [Dactylosporangium sp.]
MGQIDSTADKADNLEKVHRMTAQAASEGAHLVVFPEYTMYQSKPLDLSSVAAAEPLDGPFCTAVRTLAAERRVAIAIGVLEEIPGEDRAYNTIFIAGPDGSHVTEYRKLHLYDAFGDRESDILRPGEHCGAVTFEIAGVTVGVMTCYDLRFPEIARSLADAGAELAILPASWTPGPRKEDHWEVLTRARAIENTYFLASVSQAPPISTGGSLLVDPMGTVVGEIGENAGVGTYTVDPARVSQVRQKNPCLENRRFAISALEAAVTR